MRIDMNLRPALFLAVFLGLFSGCAERGTHPPIIHSLAKTTTHPTVHPTKNSLRISTANLWGVSVLGFDWAEEIDARFGEMAARLSDNAFDLDVVLIQEAWKDSARRALMSQPGVIRNFPHRVDSLEEPGGGGLVVLSRFPIESDHFHRFEAQGSCIKFWEGDCLSGKGVLLTRIRVHDRSLWIANTHLIACYANGDAAETECDQEDPNGRDRERQIIEARRVIEHRVGDEPVILAGDLNFTRTSRYYALMTSPEVSGDPPEIGAARRGSSVARGWVEPGEETVTPNRLDYLWTRAGTRLRWHAIRSVRAVFAEPVRLRSGRHIALSDHPILMGEFCLVRIDDPDTECLALGRDASP